ncbi:hypothetical protein OG2516_08638 [Oceanicola granulosus HTCC2516]|uniref:HIG1 domain-containing protein n=1 Tax=Oceanicola granulosus (strain ATCC BAA-861 / DSM 15982 / KCTC 12143 / HTCC2516) TaxID=314256 RepID=Q2CAW8_OCEGH|nr:twin transmembrane helix small protein [Oceanicola granulosus]EAR49808.1 hypothetical protein OG2516_08638 [Oceanicola granulosus HTCC2516]
MASDPLFIVAAIAVLGVAAILLAGIGNFGLGGDPKRSNKLMRWRIIGQFAAVLLVLLFVFVGSRG